MRLTEINWFGMETDNKTFHGLWSRGYRDMLDQMASLGYNTLRVPFSNDALKPGATATSVDAVSNPDLVGLSPLQILDKVVDYAYDQAKAKAMLAQAGYPNGVEVELWYLPVTRPYNPDGKRMAELIQSDWEKVGVKAKLITYEWGEYRKRSKTGEQHSIMFGWSGDNGDPDNFFVPLLGCSAVKGGSGNTAPLD